MITEGKILVGHILASDRDNLLATIVLAMLAHIPVSTLVFTLLPYPTLSEVIRQAAVMLSEQKIFAAHETNIRFQPCATYQ